MEISFDTTMSMQVSAQIVAEAKTLPRKSYPLTESCIASFVVRFMCWEIK